MELFFSTNIIEGIYLMGKYQPQVILMDSKLQNPSTTQIMRSIKKLHTNAFFICLLTPLQQPNLFKDDFDEVFLKSSSIVSLINLIERVLK